MDIFKMLQLFSAFMMFLHGVANLNKAVLEKSKLCGSKIENTHLKGKHDPAF